MNKDVVVRFFLILFFGAGVALLGARELLKEYQEASPHNIDTKRLVVDLHGEVSSPPSSAAREERGQLKPGWIPSGEKQQRLYDKRNVFSRFYDNVSHGLKKKIDGPSINDKE